jgi:hypothetical protein
VWDQLRDEPLRQALEIAERYADGHSNRGELMRAACAIVYACADERSVFHLDDAPPIAAVFQAANPPSESDWSILYTGLA